MRTACLAAALACLLAPAAARAKAFVCVVDVSMIPDSALMGPDTQWIAQAASTAMSGGGVVPLDQLSPRRRLVSGPASGAHAQRLVPDVYVDCEARSQPAALEDLEAWGAVVARPPAAGQGSTDSDDDAGSWAGPVRRAAQSATLAPAGRPAALVPAVWRNDRRATGAAASGSSQDLDPLDGLRGRSGRSSGGAGEGSVRNMAFASYGGGEGGLLPASDANGAGLGAGGAGYMPGEGASSGQTPPGGSPPPPPPTAVASAPEPSVWSLLVLGLGGLGVALRRARQRGPVAA